MTIIFVVVAVGMLSILMYSMVNVLQKEQDVISRWLRKVENVAIVVHGVLLTLIIVFYFFIAGIIGLLIFWYLQKRWFNLCWNGCKKIDLFFERLKGNP
jgi:NADH:ubiquinone oxidoreductase subunit 6 (subunit J)